MENRVFLLVVEDMDTDRLIANLEEMQLRYMGRHHEAQRRTDEKSRLLLDTSLQLSGKPPKHFWGAVTAKVSGSISRSKSAQDVTELARFSVGSLRRQNNNATRLEESQTNEMLNDPTMMDLQTDTSPLRKAQVKEGQTGGGGEEEGERSSEDDEEEFPMEFETLELLVSAAFEQLDSDIAHLEKQFVTTATKVASPSTEGGEDLHVLGNHVTQYADRVMLFDKVFDELIANPEQMVRMELSRQKDETLVPPPPPEGVDLDLWSELMDHDEVGSKRRTNES